MGTANSTEDFEISVAGVELEFRSLRLSDPKPTGRQVILAAGLKPVEDFIVLQWLKDGDLEELDLDEGVDLRERGIERFVISKSDRTFRLELDGQREEWPAQLINGRTLKKLANKDPDGFDVFLEREDTADEEIADDQLVDLGQPGLEKFRFRRADKEVEIKVNKRTVKISRGKHTGLEIKQTAIDQGVPIKIDFVLSLKLESGKSITVGDADSITVKAGQWYTAIADDDKS